MSDKAKPDKYLTVWNRENSGSRIVKVENASTWYAVEYGNFSLGEDYPESMIHYILYRLHPSGKFMLTRSEQYNESNVEADTCDCGELTDIKAVRWIMQQNGDVPADLLHIEQEILDGKHDEPAAKQVDPKDDWPLKESQAAWDIEHFPIRPFVVAPTESDTGVPLAFDLRDSRPILAQELQEYWDDFGGIEKISRTEIYHLNDGRYLKVYENTETERGYQKSKEPLTPSIVKASQVLHEFQRFKLVPPEYIIDEAAGKVAKPSPAGNNSIAQASPPPASEPEPPQTPVETNLLDATAPPVEADEPSNLSDAEKKWGVTARDVYRACGGDDEVGDGKGVKIWQDSGKFKATPLGKCPEDSRAQLYDLEEIFSDAKNYFQLKGRAITKAKTALEDKKRPTK